MKSSRDFAPCPLKLIPFLPLLGADTSYSELCKKIKKDSYGDAGINEDKQITQL